MTREPLLSVDDLWVQFWTSRGTVHAVNGISFEIAPGETLGIVGESGSGKSVTALALLGILPRAGRVTSGHAHFGGQDLLALEEEQLRTIRPAERSRRASAMAGMSASIRSSRRTADSSRMGIIGVTSADGRCSWRGGGKGQPQMNAVLAADERR